MTSRLAYIIFLFGSLVWCALIALAPITSSGSPTLSHYLFDFFGHICHQDDARSLHIGGAKLAVCIQCAAIYFAFFVSALVLPLLRGKMHLDARTAWIIAAAPMVFDVLCDAVGIHSSTTMTRLITGGFFGFGAAQLIVPVVVQAFPDIRRALTHTPGRVYESQTG